MSERAAQALAADLAPNAGASVVRSACPLWVRREDLLAQLAERPSAFAVGALVWEASEPWVQALHASTSDPAVRLAECRDWAALIDRHSDLELEPRGSDTLITWSLIPPSFRADATECELRRGVLSALLADERAGLAAVEHTSCQTRGDAHCVFTVRSLLPRADVRHARLLEESCRLAASLQGRETLFRRMARSAALTGPFPDVRELQAVRRFMEDIEDIILVFDRNLCVLDANRAAVEFSGMSLDELRGQSARDLLSADSIKRVAESVPALVEQGFRRGLRIEGRTRRGWVPLEVSARVAENGESIVCIARDISEHLHMERELAERAQQLRAQNERIRESDLLKSEFLANVSHELTTPLTSIRGFAKMLRGDLEAELSGEPPRLEAEKRLEFLRIVHNESERMRELIGGLLELSKIESGVVTLDRAMVSLNAIVTDSLMVMKPRLDERMLRIERDLDEADERAFLDPDRMKQVVLNLLDNAIKFSPRGSAIGVRTSSTRSTVELAVRNPTRDLSEDHLERIFDRFVQRDGSFKREQGGVGLGLNLVRAIAELHGGKAWSEIPQRGGIEFRVRVPIHAEG